MQPMAAPVLAQQWAPGKTVRIVVPFPPGGTGDLTARLIGEHFMKATGQAYIVENRPGGGTVIATEAAARSASDGTTMLVMSNSFVINATLKSRLTYDPLTSFTPLCNLMYSPNVLAVHETSALKTFADFKAATAVRPPTLSVASVGPATTQHIALEMLKRAAGIEFVYVSFTGGAPVATNLLGRHVDAGFVNFHEVQEHLGRTMRALAVGADARLPALKDVPTLAELGYADIIPTAWFGLVVPSATPPAIVAAMTDAVRAAIDDRESVARIEGLGLVKVGACGADFARHLRVQHERYARAIREAGIKTE